MDYYFWKESLNNSFIEKMFIISLKCLHCTEVEFFKFQIVYFTLWQLLLLGFTYKETFVSVQLNNLNKIK